MQHSAPRMSCKGGRWLVRHTSPSLCLLLLLLLLSFGGCARTRARSIPCTPFILHPLTPWRGSKLSLLPWRCVQQQTFSAAVAGCVQQQTFSLLPDSTARVRGGVAGQFVYLCLYVPNSLGLLA